MNRAFLKPIPLALAALVIGAGVFVWYNWFFSPVVPWPGGKTPADIRQEIEAKIDAIVNAEAAPLNISGIDTSKWKTYQNLTFGFEFKLPSNYVHISEGAMRVVMKYNPDDYTAAFIDKKEIDDPVAPSFFAFDVWNGNIRNVIRGRTKSVVPQKVNTQNGIDYYRAYSMVSGCPLISFLNFDDTLIKARMNEVEDDCNINWHILDSFRIIKKEK